jgi:hypothetical protein
VNARNYALIGFGVFLLIVGLYASFYQNMYYSDYDQRWESYNPPQLPYQTVGIVLIIAGTAIAVVGFIIPSQKIKPSAVPPAPP